ncbi:MAG: Uncharacterized MFS-type transporter, partial [uncultured Solirubrobacteraceae bacterium]
VFHHARTAGPRRGRRPPTGQRHPRARPRLPGAVHGRPRRDDRERRAAVHPVRPAVLPHGPAVGHQRLHADVRRLPAPGRPGGRPLRPQAPLPRRDRRLHPRLARQRPGRELRGARRRPRLPGPRRGARLARGALHHHHDVSRGPRAHPGARRLGRHRGRRRRLRAPARRRPHRRAVVGVDLLREHPGRHRGVPALPAVRPRVPAHHARGRLRHRRRDPLHGRARDAHLRDRQGRVVRLDGRQDARPRPRRARAPRRVPRARDAPPRAARPPRDLPDPLPGHRERLHAARGGRPVRVLLLRLALPPAGPGLRRARHGPGLPPHDRGDHGRLHPLPGAHPPLRRQARPHRRPGDGGDGDGLPHAAGRRLDVPGRPAARPDAPGGRHGQHVRAAHADGHDERRGRRPGPGVGHLQHLPAGRRRARPGDPVHGGQRDDHVRARRGRHGSRRARGGLHRRLHGRRRADDPGGRARGGPPAPARRRARGRGRCDGGRSRV